MGLLDDAIREHLELKRRRGADASEISRQESEAFGGGRRAPALEVAEDPALDEPATAYEAEIPLAPVEPLDPPVRLHVAEEQQEPPRPHGDPADDLPGAPDLPAEQAPAAPSAPAPAHPHEPEEQHEPPRPHGDPADHLSQPTRAFDPEEVRAAETAISPPAPDPEVVPADDEPEGDDVLEETPEFLQETPEHDRLWFEQRPPRDFDF